MYGMDLFAVQINVQYQPILPVPPTMAKEKHARKRADGKDCKGLGRAHKMELVSLSLKSILENYGVLFLV